MKGMFKRALAGVAAAALAVTGFALGAGAANAAPADQTITITAGTNGVIDGHTFKYVQIASYVADEEGKPTNVINTVANETVNNAVTAAVNSVFGENSVPEGMDPLVWAQGVSNDPMGDNSAFPWNGDERSRSFADKLVELLDAESNAGLWTSTGTADGDALQIDGLDGGLYLIVDTTADATNASETLPMLVGTKNDAITTGMGSVVVKNEKTDTPPTKDVSGDKDQTVTQGQEVEFTITGKIPSTAGAADDYAYVFTDYANSGISIATGGITVSYGDESETLDSSKYAIDPADTTVTGVDANFDDDDTNDDATFTVTIPKSTLDELQDYAGQPLVVTYKATVTTTTTIVNNKATVTSGKNTSKPGKSPELTTTPLSFTKVGANGAKLADVVFTIAPKAGTETPDLPNGYVTEVTSNDEGVVSFAGLANGTYTITEGTNPNEGYMDMGLSFDVVIENGKVSVSGETASKWAGLDYKLVTGSDKDIKVQNVKSITELPLTGAAGTMLFTVLGLLIAGAGALVYMKSRSVKHMLRG